ncbi:MAG TPA: chaperone ClpB, partial [Clostridiales bacterium]|nr:chaperone ClpB [Clostridiales bacterium]
YEVYHKVRMSDAVIEDAVKMSERYITDRFLPDKAIDVIDEAASRANLRNKTLPLIAAKKKEVAAQNEKINELEAREYKTDEERMEA